jgi:hypothetical protein
MKKIFLPVFIIFTLIQLNAQNSYKYLFFEPHIGLSTPLGSFAANNEEALFEGVGFAANGYNIGLEIIRPLNYTGVSMFLGIDFIINGLQKEWREDWKEKVDEEFNNTSSDLKFLNYLNIPVVAGLRYELPLTYELNLFGEVGAGFNYSKITKMSVTNYSDGSNYEGTATVKPMAKLCYTLGIGATYRNRYSVCLNYKQLGSYKMKYKETWKIDNIIDPDETEEGYFMEALPIKVTTLTFGIIF